MKTSEFLCVQYTSVAYCNFIYSLSDTDDISKRPLTSTMALPHHLTTRLHLILLSRDDVWTVKDVSVDHFSLPKTTYLRWSSSHWFVYFVI